MPRRQGRRDGTARGFAMGAGWLVRLVQFARHARANSTKRWEVTMLTILLIVIVVLLLTGGVGYRRRSRRGA